MRKRAMVSLSCMILLGMLLMNVTSTVVAAGVSYQVALAKDTEYFKVTQYDKNEWITTIQKTWKLYEATYNFKNDKVGATPTGFLVNELGNNTARIEEEVDGHAKVLNFTDVDEYNVGASVYFLNQTYGTIEFYIKYNSSGNAADRFTISLKQDFATKYSLMYVANESKWLYFNNDTYTEAPNLKSINDNEWHHVTVHFECRNQTYQGLVGNTTKIIIDNTNYSWLSFESGAKYINTLYFGTNFSLANYSYDIDAIGFSWDEDYNIGDNINKWEIVSTLPSTWFEGESETVNSHAKYTTRGWVDISWTMYDVLRNVLPQEDRFLFFSIEDLGYNETEINENYTDTFRAWYGIRVFWNFTTGEFKEEPSDTSTQVFVMQDPTDYKKLLDNYQHLIGMIKNDTNIPETIRDGFTNYTADGFLWKLVLNGFSIASPFESYLTTVVDELGCQNSTVDGNVLTLDRLGETLYSIDVTYGTKGTQTTFDVKNAENKVIFEVISTGNNVIIFYVIFIIMIIFTVALVSSIIIIRKIKRSEELARLSVDTSLNK